MQPQANPFLVTINQSPVVTDVESLPTSDVTKPVFRTFKRYDNRKIYSLDKSAYVNVGEVADIVRSGQIPIVTDSRGNDVTALVLAQALLQTIHENLGQLTTVAKVSSFLRQF